MTDIQWGLLDPNAFSRGYQQSKGVFDEMAKQRKQAQLDAAMRQYALHPDDPKAINALAMVDPAAAVTARQTQQTSHLKLLDAHRDSIKVGAQIIRQINPKDDASWQQALAIAKQSGVDLTDVPQHYDPQYVQGLIATADALSPEKTAAQPNIQREADYYRSIGKPQLADQLLQRHAEGSPMVATNPDGTFTIIPRGMINSTAQGGAAPGAMPPLPPGFVLDDEGGPAPGAPGGFL